MDTAPLRSLFLRSLRRCALGVIGLAALASLPLPAGSGVALAQAVPPAVTFAPGAAPSADVDGIYQRFRAAYRALDLESAANLYAEDALYLAPDSEIVRGRPAIRKVFEGFFSAVKQRGGQLDHGPVAPGVMICMVPGGSTEIQSLRLAGVWLGV